MQPDLNTITQEPSAAVPVADAAGSSWWEAWSTIAAEPALLEVLLVVAVGGVFVLLNLRMSRLVREIRGRVAVKDYLLGVEQALHGDVAGAKQRLERVLAEDPENHHARLLFGEVLAELGEPAEAHRQHLFLRKAFKLDNQRNQLDLARNLLGVEENAAAVEAAREAVAMRPEDREALDVLFRAELAAGFPEDAGRTGGRLARQLPAGAEQDRVRGRAAAALALAGAVRLDRGGDRDAALALCTEAEAIDPECPEVRVLQARLELDRGGPAAVQALLRTAPASAPQAAPQAEDAALALTAPATAALRVDAPMPPALPTAPPALVNLVPAARYRCATCGGVLVTAAVECAHCGSQNAVLPAEPALFAPIESASAVMDEIDANRVHVLRQLDGAVAGDELAVEDLLEIGDPAVEHLLAAAVKNPAVADVVVTVLRRMGPAILPALFLGYAKLKELRLRNLGHLLQGASGSGVMGRVVQGLGREALPYFEALLETRDRDLRKILIDYYIGLGDHQQFRTVLEHYAPIEVIHRLNAAGAEALLGLLRNAERGSFFAEELLLQPVFQRTVEVLQAVAQAAEPEVLIDVLRRRGYSASLTEALVDELGEGPLAGAARDILDGFGDAALEHLLSAFADLDRADAVRAELKRRISSMGPRVVGRVCSLLGPAASSTDDEVLELLARIGADAAEPLAEAYLKTSLVEKLGGPLVGRYTHRRVMVVRALAGVQGWPVLERLRQSESDPNLKLRLAQALQTRPAAGTEGADTPAENPAENNADPDREEPHGQAG